MTTGIEWTDETWNPIRARTIVTGRGWPGQGDARVGWHCEHVSEGCRNCYAEGMNLHRFGTGLAYKPANMGKIEPFLDEAVLARPLTWRRPRLVFPCSMTDLFGDWVADGWLDEMVRVMAATPRHTYQVLTKRPDRMLDYFRALAADAGAAGRPPWPLANVWLGVSIGARHPGTARAWTLARTPAALRWWSVEPLLEDLGDLTALGFDEAADDGGRAVDWVVAGGESGAKARPLHPDWVRGLRDQCVAASVPFFFKQWGAWRPVEGGMTPVYGPQSARRPNAHFWPLRRGVPYPDVVSYRVGKAAAGCELDGREWRQWPEAALAEAAT